MQVLHNAQLKDFTNYKIGGPTPLLCIVKSVVDFEQIPNLENCLVLGGGTNILVSDSGVTNAVIKIGISEVVVHGMVNKVTIGAGVNLNTCAKDLASRGMRALAHVAGIPGTLGGAIVMNASASHGAVSDTLESVSVINKKTREVRNISKAECRFKFRNSIFKSGLWIVLSATFNYQKDDSQKLFSEWQIINDWRAKNYPTFFPSAGCWFARGWGGRDIIKKIGMVGVSRNGAVTSPMFPAFIINTGKATAKDVAFLVKEIQKKAQEIGESMPCEVITWGKI